MITLPLGFAAIIAVFYFSIAQDSWEQYLNAHSIIIVCGGTVAILAFATPSHSLRSLLDAVKNLFVPDERMRQIGPQLTRLSHSKGSQRASNNQLIQHAIDLWAQGVSDELFMILLKQKKKELEDRYLDAITALKNLAKYPPALGMTGTVIGMIDLFANLGGEDTTNIGPSLALAMTATFFGLLIANGLVQPLADRLTVRYVKNKRLYTNVFQILLLINGGEPPAIIEDEVKSRG